MIKIQLIALNFVASNQYSREQAIQHEREFNIRMERINTWLSEGYTIAYEGVSNGVYLVRLEYEAEVQE